MPTALPDHLLDATERQPAARAALAAALAAGPSHAYLFAGPGGAEMRAAARAFAAELIADGAPDPESARRRALAEPSPHPDLVWLRPPGAQHLVEEVREQVIKGIAFRPFEGERRVFVIEAAEAMADESQNALLRTLEEPPAFAHLLLLSSEPEGLRATVTSRCQWVRFAPLTPEAIEEMLRGLTPGDRSRPVPPGSDPSTDPRRDPSRSRPARRRRDRASALPARASPGRHCVPPSSAGRRRSAPTSSRTPHGRSCSSSPRSRAQRRRRRPRARSVSAARRRAARPRSARPATPRPRDDARAAAGGPRSSTSPSRCSAPGSATSPRSARALPSSSSTPTGATRSRTPRVPSIRAAPAARRSSCSRRAAGFASTYPRSWRSRPSRSGPSTC